VTSERPLGLNATLVTESEWPLKIFVSAGQLFRLAHPNTKTVRNTLGLPSAKHSSCSLIHASLYFDEELGAPRIVTISMVMALRSKSLK
jgi:hypothetical protein